MNRIELLSLMPKNKSDAESALYVVKIGYPVVAPVLRDMLLWLRTTDSEVADVFCRFFAELEPRPVDLISKHIGTTNSFLRNRILVGILPHWQKEAIIPLKLNLTILATHPDCHNNDIECFKLIVKHSLTEKEWVRGWLSFRKEQAIERVKFIETIENEIRDL